MFDYQVRPAFGKKGTLGNFYTYVRCKNRVKPPDRNARNPIPKVFFPDIEYLTQEMP